MVTIGILRNVGLCYENPHCLKIIIKSNVDDDIVLQSFPNQKHGIKPFRTLS